MGSEKDWELPQLTTSDDGCDSYTITVDNNIIKAPDITFEPDRRGLGFYLYQAMKHNKHKVAQYILDTGEEDSYSELLQRCVRTAINISSKGLTKSDVVCLCSNNHKNTCVPYFASIFSGVLIAFLHPSLPLSDTEYLLSLVKPKMIFVDEDGVDLIDESVKNIGLETSIVVFGETQIHTRFGHYLDPVEGEEEFEPVVPDDLSDTAVIFFSSGTTGLPKGILLSHYALIINPLIMIQGCIIDDSSVVLCYSPYYWISATTFCLPFTFKGRPRIVVSNFDPTKFWETVQKYKVSVTFLATVQVSQIVKCGRPENVDTSSLIYVITGGAPISLKLMNDLRGLLPGICVAQGYGSTEAAGIIAFFNMNIPKELKLLHSKPLSSGTPIPGVHYKVVDLETGETLGPNHQGELLLKSRSMTKGYYNEDASADFDSEGFLKVGDLVYYDDDFCFYVIDRLKEMLIYKSWQIIPAKLESILLQHPAVKQAVVIGLPHPEDIEHPMALVVVNRDVLEVSEEDIQKFFNEKVSDKEQLRGGVRFINQMPMTATGKIKRRELKQLVLSGQI